MAIDPGPFLRLKAAIDSTLSGGDDKSLAAKAFSDAYAVFRAEAARIADEEDVVEEFDRLFPAAPTVSTPSVARGGFDPFKAGSDVAEASSLLRRLAGWLDGFVQSARLEAEAAAYASERVRHENQ